MSWHAAKNRPKANVAAQQPNRHGQKSKIKNQKSNPVPPTPDPRGQSSAGLPSVQQRKKRKRSSGRRGEARVGRRRKLGGWLARTCGTWKREGQAKMGATCSASSSRYASAQPKLLDNETHEVTAVHGTLEVRPRRPSLALPSGTGTSTRSVGLGGFDSNAHTERVSSNRWSLMPNSQGDFLGYNLDYNELQFGDSLGSGTYGEVFSGRLRGRRIAIKRIHMGTTAEDRAEVLEDWAREVDILSRLRHDHIVRFLGTAIRDPPTGEERKCLLFELQEGSVASLLKMVRKKKVQLTWQIVLTIALDAAEAVRYLHDLQPSVLHRDLKAENLLLTSDFRCKLTDFGLSRMFDRHAYKTSLMTVCGTPCWVAPEIFRNEKYSEKVDVYSFGVVLWELWSGKKPFAEFDCAELPYLVGKKGLRPELLVHVPPRANELMEACWREEPSRRPNFAEIVWALRDIQREVDQAGQLHAPAHRLERPWRGPPAARDKENALPGRGALGRTGRRGSEDVRAGKLSMFRDMSRSSETLSTLQPRNHHHNNNNNNTNNAHTGHMVVIT